MQARIQSLWRYPVKSCSGESLKTLVLDSEGRPVGDRRWAVVNSAAELQWMGGLPRLTWVQARQVGEAGLHLMGRDGSELTLAPHAGRAVTIRAWDDTAKQWNSFEALDAGPEAAALLMRATGEPLSLVRLSEDCARHLAPNPLHLISQPSLDAWQQATPEVHMRARRARVNLVLEPLDGEDFPPFIEEQALRLSAPKAQLSITTPCVRCVMPSIDPATAVLDERFGQSLSELSQSRQPGGPTIFGVYARSEGAGRLNVGDVVTLELNF
jgi:uncharacterized protein YcbX